MTMSHKSFFALFLAGSFVAAGCSSGRDVDVSGSAAPAPGATTKGAVRVDVYDLADEANPKLVGTTKLDATGKFSEKFNIEGDLVKLMAIDDADGDGACTAGELWGSVQVKVTNDAVKGADIVLAALPCPK